jgi:exopolyphosphatase/pppGpp-phosphohydrolase
MTSGAVDRHANPDVGGLTVWIDDEQVDISMTGGGSWTIPIGPATLRRTELVSDPPTPTELTNALGFVHDYFDDIVVASPSVLATSSVAASGPHSTALARVELGHGRVPPDYRLARSDADEVFRTLVAEPVEQRRHNPGLDDEHVETIVATLCIVLSIMRRLDLAHIGVMTDGAVGGRFPDQNADGQ